MDGVEAGLDQFAEDVARVVAAVGRRRTCRGRGGLAVLPVERPQQAPPGLQGQPQPLRRGQGVAQHDPVHVYSGPQLDLAEKELVQPGQQATGLGLAGGQLGHGRLGPAQRQDPVRAGCRSRPARTAGSPRNPWRPGPSAPAPATPAVARMRRCAQDRPAVRPAAGPPAPRGPNCHVQPQASVYCPERLATPLVRFPTGHLVSRCRKSQGKRTCISAGRRRRARSPCRARATGPAAPDRATADSMPGEHVVAAS